MLATAKNQLVLLSGAVLVSLVCFFVAREAVNFSTFSYALVIIGCIVIAVAFYSPSKALYFIVASVLFSPEIEVLAVGTRQLSIRIEDVIILCMTIGWLARFSLYKGLGMVLWTPLNRPILYYSAAVLISTLMGVIFYNAGFAKSLLYWMKYMEYFFLFFLVAHNLRDLRQAHILMLAQVVTCLISGLYGYSLMMQGVGRVYAPFDPGEANTYGGYLVLMFSIMIGFILYSERKQLQLGLVGTSAILLPPFLFTLSRSSYVAIIAAVLTHLFLYHRRRYLAGLLVLLALLFVFVPDLMPVEVKHRVAATIDTQNIKRVTVMGVTFDSSFSQRLISWEMVLDKWTEYPLFGKGVTNFGFVDGQYFSHLIDLGLVGFGAFLLLLGTIVQTLLREIKNPVDLFHQGLLAGLLAAFVGLLIHAIGGNTFIIIRIMEPFWFMMGIALSYRRLYEQGTALRGEQPKFVPPVHYPLPRHFNIH